jgi:hypothetical protein
MHIHMYIHHIYHVCPDDSVLNDQLDTYIIHTYIQTYGDHLVSDIRHAGAPGHMARWRGDSIGGSDSVGLCCPWACVSANVWLLDE